MKRSIHRISACIAAAVMVAAAVIPCAAAEATPSPVRVGYFDCGDYNHTLGDGTVDSYDTAYLEAIADSCGLTFSYVDCKTWSDALQMLENHQIDLLGTMQRSTEREKAYTLCQGSYGVTAAELAALPDSAIAYEDYAAIGAATIGVLRDYVRMPELEDMLRTHALTPTIQFYDTQETLFAALEDGSVELIAANSHTLPTSWKVIEKFAYTNFYFATWKGNEQLAGQIDNALIQLQLYRPLLQTDLQTRYFPGLMQEPYSLSELDFIAKQPPLNVYINDGSAPLTYRDQDGNMIGILVELCDMIQRETGLTFRYCALAEKGDNAPGETSVVINVPDSGTARGASVSSSFFTTNFLVYCRLDKDREFDSHGAYSVVLPQNRQSFIDYLEVAFPNCQITKLPTPEECIRAVSTGEADLTMLSSYLVDNICTRKDIDNIVAIPSQGLPLDFSMILEGPDAPALTAILNKAISRMDEQEKNAIQFSYALSTVPDNTLSYFIRHNALVISLAIILVMLVIGALIYARMVEKKNRLIKKANRAKSSFLSTMSHDIRTPMNAIINIAKLAQDDYAGTGGGDVMEDLRQISSVSDFLMGLLNDVLDMSSIESGKFQLHPVPYRYEEFLTYLGSIFETLCRQKNIRFVCDKGSTALTLFVDKIRFNQIFFNLLSNAVKFTPAGGTVTYRVTDNVVSDGRLSCTFTVSDTGCGMSEAFQKKMFEPFERENATREAYQGTGLGLSIAKNIVAQMGGEIDVESVIGQGTAFYVKLTMPLATEEQIAAAGKTEEPMASLEGKHILVVEDNDTNIVVLTRFLAKRGVVCAVAHDGRESVQLFQKSQPGDYDMILMDLRMPVMDGLEATRIIRGLKRPDAASIPILAMTADAFDNDVAATKAAGMNAHLTKPVAPETLYRLVGQYLAE